MYLKAIQNFIIGNIVQNFIIGNRGRADGRTDGRTDGRKGGRTDGRADGQMHNGHVKLGDLGCAKNIPDAVAKTISGLDMYAFYIK